MAINSVEIAKVADALGDLKARCFLAGGASIPYYLTDKLEELPRVTLDIDVVIEIGSAQEYRSKVEAQMRANGFENDISEGAPICRWKLGPITVDLMPTDESILGFSNKWYQAGAASLVEARISEACMWRILSPPFMLATKCTAFSNRGIGDPGSSADLEDIVTLLNGRPEFASEISSAPTECRNYLSNWIDGALRDPTILDVLPYHLPPHAAGQARLPVVLERMKRIAGHLQGKMPEGFPVGLHRFKRRPR